MFEKTLVLSHNPELDKTRKDEFSSILLQILGIVIFGALTALGKKATMDLGIPGHSALFWLGAMVAGRSMINRTGAGFAIGVATAAWGMPLGLNHSFIYNVGLYGAAGLVLDIVSRVSFFDLRTLLGAVVAGAAAHMVKFCFIVGKSMVSVTAKRFVLFGIIKSAGLHLAFGIGAGIIAYAFVRLFQSGFKKSEEG